MNQLTQAARLKIKGDTFYLPDPDGGVYFRNNVGTFRMEGEMMDRWIEKLFPMFNGEHTLGELTDGLSAPYRERVYAIAETLYRNGFARDVSQDRPCLLPETIMERYGSQIAFLDSFGPSGAYRFERYREARVLTVGSGPFVLSLVSALLESGLPKFDVVLTDAVPTNRSRLNELVRHAYQADAELEVKELAWPGGGEAAWRELVRPFQTVMYVSPDGDIGEVRTLQSVCREEGKRLFPAMFLHQAGVAGPLVAPGAEVTWESAWRRLHRTEIHKDPELHAFSPTAAAMLANVLVFEHLKTVTETGESGLRNGVYMLNLETLEGSWHQVLPHPSADAGTQLAPEWIPEAEARLVDASAGGGTNGLLHYFNQLTSKQTGIFHAWEEADLRQLPLSQCLVQAADPLGDGPAGLLPETVCSGFTHEEARREAGLAGLETYVSRRTNGRLGEVAGVGAGATAAEAAARGIQSCLDGQLAKRHAGAAPVISPLELGAMEDERCRFYLQALTIMRGIPIVGLGEELFGLPVVWVGTGGRWYGSAGLNLTRALRKALQGALMNGQNEAGRGAAQTVEASAIVQGGGTYGPVAIPASGEVATPADVRDALHVLRRNGKQLHLADLAAEPFLKQMPGVVLGVALREVMP
ncbi:putative thiazole-containing bacteriocin maturation protein [Paenibacillus sp. GYB004]|uniref:putative thiazole-containing bacteriocin maturation protein n=1 Tax=Paenibacillus sp. GYB004 TaxID=2994393 RepID=UPI002F96102A